MATCPHGLEPTFNPLRAPSAFDMPRTVAITDSEDCPGCLMERVRNLRLAVDGLLRSTTRKESRKDRELFDASLGLYFRDLSEYFRPHTKPAPSDTP